MSKMQKYLLALGVLLILYLILTVTSTYNHLDSILYFYKAKHIEERDYSTELELLLTSCKSIFYIISAVIVFFGTNGVISVFLLLLKEYLDVSNPDLKKNKKVIKNVSVLWFLASMFFVFQLGYLRTHTNIFVIIFIIILIILTYRYIMDKKVAMVSSLVDSSDKCNFRWLVIDNV